MEYIWNEDYLTLGAWQSGSQLTMFELVVLRNLARLKFCAEISDRVTMACDISTMGKEVAEWKNKSPSF